MKAELVPSNNMGDSMAYERVFVEGFVWDANGCCKWLGERGIWRVVVAQRTCTCACVADGKVKSGDVGSRCLCHVP